MKKRVLVFPCGSEIGLEVYNSVNNSTHFELFGLSSVKDHGEFVYGNYIDGIGHYNSENFIEDLKKIIKDKKIDIIYPTMDSVIVFLKYHEKQLGVPVVGPSYEVAKICSSKRKSYNQLSGIIRVPKLYSKEQDNLPFPLFAKPDVGYGSRNAKQIIDKVDLENIEEDTMVLCEYLPGKEYTIDCFTGKGGELLFVGARERSRTLNGISVNTKTDSFLTSHFKEIAHRINSQIAFRGAWFFQSKLDSSGEPCLLEIACRFAGSSSVHRIKGINFALASLFLALGKDVEFLVNSFDVESDRSLNNVFKLNIKYEKVFIDYDDTIIVNGLINLDAVKFLYHAVNCEKKIVLITKHKGDILKQLVAYKLSNLFDEIIHLNLDEEKSYYMRQSGFNDSIFIDDSFEERRKIFRELGIPVISLDSISALIN